MPEWFRNIIRCYYDSLAAKVCTDEWSTEFFLYESGLFQGCVISAILFDLVFQLLLDLVQQKVKTGYNFKEIGAYIAQLAYADDHSLIASNPQNMQLLCNEVAEWLKWTNCMEAKPKKCRALALKRFATNDKGPFKALQKAQYSSFDPKISISGEPIQNIGDDLFKFLGRKIRYDLDETIPRKEATDLFNGRLHIVDELLIKGPDKAWLYAHLVIPRIQWYMQIYNFPVSVGETWTATTTKYLKKWLGLAKAANPDILFRSIEHHGINLPHPKYTLKQAQVTRSLIVSTSPDPNVKAAHDLQNMKVQGRVRFAPEVELQKKLSQIEHEAKFPKQNHGRQGLGWTQRQNVSLKENLRRILREDAEHDRRLKDSTLSRQSQHLNYADVLPWDLGLGAMCKQAPNTVKFRINAVANTLACPSNRRLWGMTPHAKCGLCGKDNATAALLLSGAASEH